MATGVDGVWPDDFYVSFSQQSASGRQKRFGVLNSINEELCRGTRLVDGGEIDSRGE
jgi:hypothetical protein